MVIASPGLSISIAVLYASASLTSSAGYESKEVLMPLYAREMLLCKCSPKRT